LDHVGFFTLDVASAQAIASILVPDWQHAGIAEKAVLGVPTGPYMAHTSEAGMENFAGALDQLRRSGFSVNEVPAMSDYEQIADRHRLILASEAAQVHAQWFDQYETLYASKTAELIRKGKQVSVEALKEALAGRARLRADLQGVMEQNGIDLWLSPSAPGTAPEGLDSTGDPAMNLPWTHAGVPTITLPSGWDEKNLPFGIQVTADWGADEYLLAHAPSVESILVGTSE
jgi:Asp-tRNA(Asn)/Glu-tRNA(Gln) amidotransferase A subunit family amidase